MNIEEPLDNSGRIKLPSDIGAGKIININAPHVYKTWARNSFSIAKPAFVFMGSTGIDDAGINSIGHDLFRGFLSILCPEYLAD